MKEFDYGIVKNPEIFLQNRLEAHSDHLYYREKEGDCRYSMNGMWKFSYAENFEKAVKGFEKMECDCHEWDEIPVPAHIQLQGYDTPVYVNTQYPWEGVDDIRPGEIPERFNPVASYVKYFEVPEEMKGQRLFISFQGVESASALWLNGKYVGYSEDSFTPAEFDLTPYLREGENKLAVRVFKWSAGSWCEDQDFFRFSGIFRDVFLFVEPELHVRDLKVETLLEDTYKNAVLRLTMKILRDGGAGGMVSVSLQDGEAVIAAGEAELTAGASCAPGKRSSDEIVMEIPVLNPGLWSAENPKLYDLTICLQDETGEVMETACSRVGFRRFEIRDSVMLLNGRRIVFKGVNRHEFSAKTGRVMDEDVIRFDLEMMKRNNINAIRTSHYPNSGCLYRLCDQYGLYVIDETNLETHGCWDAIVKGMEDISFAVPGDRPEYTDLVLDRANSMYQRDKNHACILIWSLGNESFGGSNLGKMREFFHSQDASRPVHYEGIHWDRRVDASDIESTMYAPVSEIKEWLSIHREKPYINCEYSHAMGNSCGAIQKYTDLTEEDPLFQGGFIWDYIDQCLEKKDRYGKTYYGYGGDFGDYPNDGNFSGNGIVYGDNRMPAPKMQEIKYCYQDIKISFEENKGSAFGYDVVVWNKNLFTNTDRFRCVMSMMSDGEEVSSLEGELPVKPSETGRFPIPVKIPEDGKEHILTVSFVLKKDTVWAKAGHELAYAQLVLPGKEENRTEETSSIVRENALPGGNPLTIKTGRQNSCKKLRVVRGWSNIGVEGEDFSALFSVQKGGLVSYKWKGRQLLEGTPKPNFWRAMTDNDIAALLPDRAGAFKTASQYITNKYEHGRRSLPCSISEKEDSVVITCTCFLTGIKDLKTSLSYRVSADGRIETELILPPCREAGELPEISVLFSLPACLEYLTWYGKGPVDCYPDTSHGKYGIWKGTVKDQLARYLRPQESGWKSDVRRVSVMDREGSGMLFMMEASEGLGFSALPYNPHQLELAAHPNELPDPYHTYVRVGYQMGVGGDDTWGAEVHPEYRLDNTKEIKVRFSFKGI